MQNYDMSHLPVPVHDAVLALLATLVQAFPLAPAAAVQVDGPSVASAPRFPRSDTEMMILETLEALAPAPVSPQQLAAMLNRPHVEVRTILQALAMLGTIAHPAKGLYRDTRVEDRVRPSVRFATRIAAVCTPSTKGITHD